MPQPLTPPGVQRYTAFIMSKYTEAFESLSRRLGINGEVLEALSQASDPERLLVHRDLVEIAVERLVVQQGHRKSIDNELWPGGEGLTYVVSVRMRKRPKGATWRRDCCTCSHFRGSAKIRAYGWCRHPLELLLSRLAPSAQEVQREKSRSDAEHAQRLATGIGGKRPDRAAVDDAKQRKLLDDNPFLKMA